MLLTELLMKTHGYVVGGAIRNSILGIPIKDYDVTTPFTTEELKTLLPIAYPVGEKFGTLAVLTKVGYVEITTMRVDLTEGRHPETRPTTSLYEDLARRDFTMNAIAEDVLGKRYDPYNGISDIQNRLIRTVGNPITRIREDRLRAMRAVRFSVQLGFNIDTHLKRVISNTNLQIGEYETKIIENEEVKIPLGVSIERVMDEFSKMFIIDPVKTLKELAQYNLLSQFIPEFQQYKFCDHDPLHHPEGNLENHILDMLSRAPKDYTILLAILFHDVGKLFTKNGTTYHNHDQVGAEYIKTLALRLKLSKFQSEALQFVCANHMKLHNIEQMRPAKRQALYQSQYWSILYTVHKLDGGDSPSHIAFIDEDSTKVTIKPFLNGHDVLALGVTGQRIGSILETMLNFQLENKVTSREEALALLPQVIS